LPYTTLFRSIGERFAEQPRPLLLDARDLRLVAQEDERPRAPDRRRDAQEHVALSVLHVEALRQQREALLHRAQHAAVPELHLEPLEEPTKRMHRAHHHAARRIEEVDLEPSEVAEEHPREEGEAAFALLGREEELAPVELNRVLVARLEPEQLDELLALDHVELGASRKDGQDFGHGPLDATTRTRRTGASRRPRPGTGRLARRFSAEKPRAPRRRSGTLAPWRRARHAATRSTRSSR